MINSIAVAKQFSKEKEENRKKKFKWLWDWGLIYTTVYGYISVFAIEVCEMAKERGLTLGHSRVGGNLFWVATDPRIREDDETEQRMTIEISRHYNR